MSIIKADINKMNSMISYINDKANESNRLCNQISNTYNQVPWKGIDRSFVDQTADRMRLAELKKSMEDFKDYSGELRDWIRCIEMYQDIMKELIGRLQTDTLVFVR